MAQTLNPGPAAVTIRPAGSSDARALSELATATYIVAFGSSLNPTDLTSHLERNLSPAAIERMMEEDTILVAEDAGRLVGFAQFGACVIAQETASANDRELRRLYVLADYQNRGIGARLMDAALAHPDMADAGRVYLDVWEHNPGAQRFYARYGFEVIGAQRFFVESGTETSRDVIMVRRHSRNGETGLMSTTVGPGDLPIVLCESREGWAAWLQDNHATSDGVWLQLAKKASHLRTVTYDEAVEVALCYGWIDSQIRGYDTESSLQKFTPRRARSIWSRINREKAQRLIDTGQMQPAGLRAVEAAQRDGRWAAAYESPAQATVPADLVTALDGNPAAAAFFATLDSRNRYAILHRIQIAKTPETRARRIRQFVEMLAKQEKLHP